MENHDSTEDVDIAKDSSGDGIQGGEDAEVFSSDMSSMAMSSVPSGSSPHSSLQLPSSSKIEDNDDRDVAHAGRVSGTKKVNQTPTGGKMHVLGLGMVDSWDAKKNHDVSPGAIPLRSPRNPATSQASRSPISSYDSARESTNDESKQEDGVPDSAGAYPDAHDSRRMAAGSVYTVEALCVPDGNEDGAMMVAEAQHLTLKWYQRPLYRWIFLGTPPTTAPIAPAIPPSTPTSLTPEAIACNFLDISNVTKCRLTLKFGGMTIDSTIPSEIGLLTQLTYLSFYTNYLTSTIPSEIGLLTKLTFMNFEKNSFTSTIPSEIGRLTQLTALDFSNNFLTSAIPSEIGLLTKLTYLDFEINSFTSTIQSAFSRLTQLELLDLSSNAMTSTIPSEIGLLTKLSWLYVDNNLFTSAIPSEIRSLTQLNVLSFFNNSLTSTIPSEIELLTQLTQLALFNNELKGTIPSSLCSLPFLYLYIYIDCGEIICAPGCCVDSDSKSCG
ncbi:hypothetical protein MHU86_9226 [Fragilaria crotonensis]|nr:hypothetical protein MHU86_9226 [Fragilaria crotonensis]